MNAQFHHLFEPLSIGNRQARNRIMRLATTTNTAEGNVPSERTIALYRDIARGGTGMIVTESMRVHGSNLGRAGAMLLFRREIVPPLRALADAVHAEGSLLFAQLNHGGRQHHANEIPTLWGPSPIACPHSGGVPHAMTKNEISDLVAAFAHAALNAKLAGLDGVEIHGAQGHLIQEFVSPFSNQRDDEYGGTPENRWRFSNEIIAAVRAAVGSEFIVGYRMGVDEFSPGGITVDDSKAFAAYLAARGEIDYLSLAQGNFNSIDAHLPDSHYPHATFVDLHAQVKAMVPGMPVVTSARIQTPEQAEAILAAGKADVVGLCRALIADPAWPKKAMSGHADEVRRCICCNRCWSAVVGGKRLSCTVNAMLGFETELAPVARAAERKKVVVVGGGPGGLEAARVAAERGHRVTLFEKSAKLGGKLAYVDHFLPYHESGYAIEFLSKQAAKLEVDIRMSTEATRETVLKERPDAVIVAAGAKVLTPRLAGDGSVPVASFSRAAAGARVVVMDEDGYYWASCMVESIARRGCHVIYVTRFLEALRELPEVSRISTLRVLDEFGVECHPNMYVDGTEGGTVILRHYYNAKHEERLKDIAEIVWLGAQRANDALAQELRDAGVPDVHVIGDAYAPRRLGHAIAEGHRAGRAV